MIEAAFYARAIATAGITTLIGTTPARVFPNAVPRTNTVYPAAAYQLISDVREEVMGVNAGIRHARLQVTCVALSYLTARTLGEAFVAAFNRYRGTSAGIVIHDTFIENEAGNLDQSVGLDTGDGIALSTLDLIFHYEG